MTNREHYQNAMNRIVPSEQWKSDTLAVLAKARAEQEPPGRKGPLLQIHRRTLVLGAAAAAFALLVVPSALYLMNHNGLLPAVGGKSAAACAEGAIQAPAEPAPMTEENGSRMREDSKAEFALEAQDQIQSLFDSAPQKLVLRADSPAALAGNNPTAGLTQEELPDTLPVWNTPAAEEQKSEMQRIGDSLALTLYYDPAQEEGLLCDAQGTAVWVIHSAETGSFVLEKPSDAASSGIPADEMAAEQLRELLDFTEPQTEQLPGQSFCYDGDDAGNLEKKLLQYSFGRVSGTAAEDGTLLSMTLTLPPAGPLAGRYPLCTPEEALHRLEGQLDDTPGEGGSWWIEYQQSSGSTLIQPVYVFAYQTGPSSVTEYRVSALRE